MSNTLFPVPDCLTIHRAPLWNKPAEPRFTPGDHVITRLGGRVGRVVAVIHAPATSGMRCRPNHYHLDLGDGADHFFAEDELVTADELIDRR